MNPEILDCVPPSDEAAERGVIGSILLDARKLADVAPLLRPDDFYVDAHQKLFAYFLAMDDANQAIDVALVATRMKERGELEAVGGAAYLSELLGSVPVAAHAVYYAKIVARKAVYRRLRSAGEDLIQQAHNATDSPDEILDRAEALLSGVRNQDTKGPRPAREAVIRALERAEEQRKRRQSAGYLTGVEKYDEHYGGLFPGELVILAARPGQGKTSLALQIAAFNAEQGRGVYFASLEMEDDVLLTRLLAGRAGVNTKRIRTGALDETDYDLLSEAARPFGACHWWIHDAASLTTTQIRRACRRLAKERLHLVIVDYLQLLTPVDATIKRYEQVGQMSKALKELARELRVPVLCLSQLNRASANDRGKPNLHHLRESGSIEQDADVVLMLHLPLEAPKDHSEAVPVELLIRKNRNDATAFLELDWIRTATEFRTRGASRYEEFEEYGTQ